MSTNWEKAVSQDSFDAMNSKIGNSTDAETAGTVFGRLLGIRNVVDWVKNTWTAAKAGLLDAAISTRAPASTALSTATWTATRAGKLDNLDATISTRATQASVNALASSLNSGIKSVQKGTASGLTDNSNININSVNIDKSFVLFGPHTNDIWSVTLYTNRIQIRRGGTGTAVAVWQVIEFN